MLKAPVPDIVLNNIYELKPGQLIQRGIKFLLMDLDNTLAPYSLDRPTVALLNWTDGIKKAGIEPFILSNNRGSRPEIFAKSLAVDYTGKARKPLTKKLSAVLCQKGYSVQEAAIIGDQIYTDVLCGKQAGILTIAVRPIDMRNPFRALRYILEYPFRRAGIK